MNYIFPTELFLKYPGLVVTILAGRMDAKVAQGLLRSYESNTNLKLIKNPSWLSGYWLATVGSLLSGYWLATYFISGLTAALQ